MKLDIAAAAGRSRGTQFACRDAGPVLQPDAEPVTAARLAVVLHSDSEPHGKSAPIEGDFANPTDVTRVRKIPVHKVSRDLCAFQVGRRTGGVIENVDMPPERAMFASTMSAK